MKNKSFSKFFFSKINFKKIAHLLFSFSSLLSTFHFNERLFHLDYVLNTLDPNLICDYTESSKKNKENLEIQIFQAIIFDDLKNKKD